MKNERKKRGKSSEINLKTRNGGMRSKYSKGKRLKGRRIKREWEREREREMEKG